MRNDRPLTRVSARVSTNHSQRVAVSQALVTRVRSVQSGLDDR